MTAKRTLDPRVPHVARGRVDFLPDRPRPSRHTTQRLLNIFRQIRWGDDLEAILAYDQLVQKYHLLQKAGLVVGRGYWK